MNTCRTTPCTNIPCHLSVPSSFPNPPFYKVLFFTAAEVDHIYAGLVDNPPKFNSAYEARQAWLKANWLPSFSGDDGPKSTYDIGLVGLNQDFYDRNNVRRVVNIDHSIEQQVLLLRGQQQRENPYCFDDSPRHYSMAHSKYEWDDDEPTWRHGHDGLQLTKTSYDKGVGIRYTTTLPYEIVPTPSQLLNRRVMKMPYLTSDAGLMVWNIFDDKRPGIHHQLTILPDWTQMKIVQPFSGPFPVLETFRITEALNIDAKELDINGLVLVQRHYDNPLYPPQPYVVSNLRNFLTIASQHPLRHQHRSTAHEYHQSSLTETAPDWDACKPIRSPFKSCYQPPEYYLQVDRDNYFQEKFKWMGPSLPNMLDIHHFLADNIVTSYWDYDESRIREIGGFPADSPFFIQNTNVRGAVSHKGSIGNTRAAKHQFFYQPNPHEIISFYPNEPQFCVNVMQKFVTPTANIHYEDQFVEHAGIMCALRHPEETVPPIKSMIFKYNMVSQNSSCDKRHRM